MSDPRRLLDDLDDLSPAERRALVAARGDRPPSELVDGAWSGLLAKIPLAGPAGPAAGSGTSGGSIVGGGSAGAGGATSLAGTAAGGAIVAGTAAAIKAALIGAAFGAVVLTGRAVVSSKSVAIATEPAPIATTATREGAAHEAEPRSAILPTAVTTTTDKTPDPAAQGIPVQADPKAPPAPRALAGNGRRPGEESPEARDLRAKGSVAPSEAPRAVPAAPIATTSVEDAREETRLVASAREALRSGRWSEGSALLEQARGRFPDGVLLQEREALGIEALVLGGQRARAVERAQAFFRSYPESPHAARIRAVIAGP